MPELMVSIFLLSLVLVMVILLFTKLLAATTKGGDQLVGVLYAEKVLDEAITSPNPSYPAFSTTTGQQGIYTHDEANQTRFYHTLTATELALAGTGELWQLDVEVRWWTEEGDQAQARTNYGNLFVRESRTVYVRR